MLVALRRESGGEGSGSLEIWGEHVPPSPVPSARMMGNLDQFDPKNQDYPDPTSEVDLRLITCKGLNSLSVTAAKGFLFDTDIAKLHCCLINVYFLCTFLSFSANTVKNLRQKTYNVFIAKQLMYINIIIQQHMTHFTLFTAMR